MVSLRDACVAVRDAFGIVSDEVIEGAFGPEVLTAVRKTRAALAQEAQGDQFDALAKTLRSMPSGWGWLIEVWQGDPAWAQVVQRQPGETPRGMFAAAEAATPAEALEAALAIAKDQGSTGPGSEGGGSD